MNFKNIVLEFIESVGILTINRPEQLNALNKLCIEELSICLLELEQNKKVKVIIITGSGQKAFVAGADIKEFIHFSPKEGKELSQNGHDSLFNKIENYPKPIIAAINGFALGGGLELALACHIRLAADNAKLGLPEVSLGLIPGYGGTQRLTQLVGKGKALELILSANMLPANEALNWGLVNHVYSSEDLLPKSIELATKIANNSSHALSQALRAVCASLDQKKGLETEIQLFGECFGTEDFKEGTSAFIEKRKPNFN